ncbi:hypothetical protein LXL04_001798 [Taraxacum kok-saghyz]
MSGFLIAQIYKLSAASFDRRSNVYPNHAYKTKAMKQVLLHGVNKDLAADEQGLLNAKYYYPQPPHKNVNSGPYLCPNHTKCQAVLSQLQGMVLVSGYTCCDACGRLFVKGNSCPFYVKSIENENQHPWYGCATYHGECYQVKDIEDVVSVTFDDGKTSNVDLEKQGIKFV